MTKPERDVHVPDIPGPRKQLCWQQSPLMVRCDRPLGHGGLHTWEAVERCEQAEAERDRLKADLAEAQGTLSQIMIDLTSAFPKTTFDPVRMVECVRQAIVGNVLSTTALVNEREAHAATKARHEQDIEAAFDAGWMACGHIIETPRGRELVESRQEALARFRASRKGGSE